MKSDKHRVCPVERAGGLEGRFRRWLQNPQRILSPFVATGMTAMDIGCGPGFFTIELARLVGSTGRVVAVDLQDGMLDKVRKKIAGTELEPRIVLHRCETRRLGIARPVDFALAFWMVHEVPDPAGFFGELAALLRPGGQVLIVEPAFHVSKQEFAETLRAAYAAGFARMASPRLFFSRAALLKIN